MATDLYAIARPRLDPARPFESCDALVQRMVAYAAARKSCATDDIAWQVDYGRYKGGNIQATVEVSGADLLLLFMSTTGTVMSTGYRYSELYRAPYFDDERWIEYHRYGRRPNDSLMRFEFYHTACAIGADEVIYVADNACDKLSRYQAEVMEGNMTYEEVEAALYLELGAPVMIPQLDASVWNQPPQRWTEDSADYFRRIEEMKHVMTYRNILEWVQDDFSDLKAR